MTSSNVDNTLNKAKLTIRQELDIILVYLKRKFLEGLYLGTLFIILDQVNRHGSFGQSYFDMLTKFNVSAILVGLISAFAYMLVQPSKGVFSIMCSLWFDWVQQFFTLGSGAFLLIKPYALVFWPVYGVISWQRESKGYSFILVGAAIMGSLWALKETKNIDSTITRQGMGAFIAITSVALINSLQLSSGSDDFLNIFFFLK